MQIIGVATGIAHLCDGATMLSSACRRGGDGRSAKRGRGEPAVQEAATDRVSRRAVTAAAADAGAKPLDPLALHRRAAARPVVS